MEEHGKYREEETEKLILLKQMIVLFLIMLIGYYIARIGVLDEATGKKISWLVVNVGNPALVVSGSLGDNEIPVGNLARIVLVAVVMYGLLVALAQFAPRLFGVKEEAGGAYRVMTVFTNIGFMGFPILSAMYGSSALLYGSLFLLPYNLLIYTYGISTIKGGFSWKELHKVLNIGVLACLVSIGIYVLKMTARAALPEVFTQTVTLLSNITAPLSMMVIGASLARMSWKELAGDVRLILFSLVRLIVVPLLFILGIRQFVADPVMLGVCLVMLGTPAGSMTVMLSQQYGGDVGTTSRGVALTTILSVVTLPLLFALTGL